MPKTSSRTGVALHYQISGNGEPLLLSMGTSGSIALWGDMIGRLEQTHQVIDFDNLGLGGSERGDGTITVASMAEDAWALLEALDVPKVVVGEQDLLTPPWQARKVADAIPGAVFELVPGSDRVTACTSNARTT